jgi:hypothetical protein
MSAKPYTEIVSLSGPFVEAIVELSGRPDNFVDSAEGSFVGMPDLEGDQSARELDARLEETLDELADAHRGNGSSTARP